MSMLQQCDEINTDHFNTDCRAQRHAALKRECEVYRRTGIFANGDSRFWKSAIRRYVKRERRNRLKRRKLPPRQPKRGTEQGFSSRIRPVKPGTLTGGTRPRYAGDGRRFRRSPDS